MTQGDSRGIATPGTQHEDRPRFALSATQLAASVLAAVTAAVLASYLGVNGTVIGAATVSLLSAVGTAVYSHSLERTGHRVRTVVPASARWIPAKAAGEIAAPVPIPAPARSHNRLSQIGITAAAVFAAALALLTTVELFAGRPISDLVRGQAASGTTVFGSQPKQQATPTPTVTVTVVPKIVVTTPTVTQTAPAVTVTPTVTATPTPSATPTPPSTTTTP